MESGSDILSSVAEREERPVSGHAALRAERRGKALEVVATGEAYSSRAAAVKGTEAVCRAAADAEVVDAE